MAKRFVDNLAVFAKKEATYGTDATPTGLLNALQMTNAAIEPLVGEDLSRELSLPFMGHQGIILDGNYGRVSGEVEIAGSGAAGTAPAVGPMLCACALKEVITAATDVKYSPVSRLFDSVTMYFNDDGVNHILLGARGTVTLSLTPGQIPRFVFTMTGLLGTVADIPIPANIDLSDFQTPVPINKANTTVSLHGFAGACEGLTMDLANAIESRMLINSESIEMTARQSTGSAIFEAALLAEKNWLQTAKAHTKGALAAQHGTAPGNIFKIAAPAVQIGRLTYGVTQKIRNNTLPLMFTPVAGNDEFVLTFQ